MYVAGIFCDLAKAFDCVNHEILLTKLHSYGIWGISEVWFRSYLTNRRQKVDVKWPNSTIFFFWLGNIEKGIPQGSILGSLLFIMFINNFLLRINSLSEPITFGDDTSVIIWNRNFKDFCSESNLFLSHMIK